MSRVLVLLLGGLLCLSCVTEMDIPVASDDDQLYLECFPESGSDCVSVCVYPALPINNDLPKQVLETVSITLRLNDDVYTYANVPLTNNMYNCHLDRCLTENDLVYVEVEANGYSVIRATSLVPKGPDFKISMMIIEDKLNMQIGLRGISESNYYALCLNSKFEYEKISWDSGQRVQIFEEKTFDSIYEFYTPVLSLEDESMGFNTFSSVQLNGKDMIVFEDGATKDLSVSLVLPYLRDRYDLISGNDTTVRRIKYALDVFNITKSAYKSLNPKINQTLIGLGAAFPSLDYTNVEGGFGVLSCMGKTESGWVSNVDPL